MFTKALFSETGSIQYQRSSSALTVLLRRNLANSLSLRLILFLKIANLLLTNKP